MIERSIERAMYASRWVLAPIYLGLSLALFAIGIKFFQEIWHVLPNVFEIHETNLVLAILALVDMVLVSGLVIMVMLSGYENFVSKIDVDEETEKLGWLGKLDPGSLKAKVAASIVAISSIHLLRAFMNAEQIDNNKLVMYVVIHMTFVFSALLMGYLDKITHAYKGH